MKSKILFLVISGLITAYSFGCNKISDKINEKTDEVVREQLEKVDSSLKASQKMIDSMKTLNQMDTVAAKLDSASKEIEALIKMQEQKINELKNK
jgi:peptidoglycan hydrolase CwlO-like protein